MVDAGALELADAHVGVRLGELCQEPRESVRLAAALAVRALREGSVCLPLSQAGGYTGLAEDGFTPTRVEWPDPSAWAAQLADSPMVTLGADGPSDRPLRLVGESVYLERYHRFERRVVEALVRRRDQAPPRVDEDALEASLARLAKAEAAAGRSPDARQEDAARAAVRHWTSVVAGGPGTGKTHTVAKVLSVLADQPAAGGRVQMAAPTGKAALRLGHSVGEALAGLGSEAPAPSGVTLHRLLGARGRSGFVHDRANPLGVDTLVVDEASMVSLPLMARVLEALPAAARLVLVGDPDQLASVEAGAVLGDIVGAAGLLGPPDGGQVVTLEHAYRFSAEIAAAAGAIRDGRADELAALLREGRSCRLVEADCADASPADLPELAGPMLATARQVASAAVRGDAEQATRALETHRLLCAHRDGPYGVARWNRACRHFLAASIPGYGVGEWYPGQPLLVTENAAPLWNGDSAVVCVLDGRPVAAVARAEGPIVLPPFRLGDAQEQHALTVHKAQGSQYGRVAVILPPPGSPLLTRQLLYTAFTRAVEGVTLFGSAESVAQAVRTPARRASGLR